MSVKIYSCQTQDADLLAKESPRAHFTKMD